MENLDSHRLSHEAVMKVTRISNFHTRESATIPYGSLRFCARPPLAHLRNSRKRCAFRLSFRWEIRGAANSKMIPKRLLPPGGPGARETGPDLGTTMMRL